MTVFVASPLSAEFQRRRLAAGLLVLTPIPVLLTEPVLLHFLFGTPLPFPNVIPSTGCYSILYST